MKILSLASLLVVSVAATAAACGSSDDRTAARGAGGEAGDMTGPTTKAGAPSQGDGAGAGPDSGGAGGASGGAAGEQSAGGAPALGGAPGSAGAGGESGATGGDVLDLGFEDSAELPANLDSGGALLTPSQGFAPLGPVGNQFGETFLRGPTGTVITLTLSDLPAHETLSLSLLFAAIDSLDGEGTFPAGDYFKITLDDLAV